MLWCVVCSVECGVSVVCTVLSVSECGVYSFECCVTVISSFECCASVQCCVNVIFIVLCQGKVFFL